MVQQIQNQGVINQILDAIYEGRERFNEKFSITLPPTRW